MTSTTLTVTARLVPQALALVIALFCTSFAYSQSCENKIDQLDKVIKDQYVQRDWSNFWVCQILLGMALRNDAKLSQHQIARLSNARRLAVRLKNDHQDRICIEAIEKAIHNVNA